jgi:transposase
MNTLGEEPPLAVSERARLREKEVHELRLKNEFLGKAFEDSVIRPQ